MCNSVCNFHLNQTLNLHFHSKFKGNRDTIILLYIFAFNCEDDHSSHNKKQKSKILNTHSI